PTVVNCPACQRPLRVVDDLLGRPVRCPTCRTVFTGSPANGQPAASAAPTEVIPPTSTQAVTAAPSPPPAGPPPAPAPPPPTHPAGARQLSRLRLHPGGRPRIRRRPALGTARAPAQRPPRLRAAPRHPHPGLRHHQPGDDVAGRAGRLRPAVRRRRLGDG